MKRELLLRLKLALLVYSHMFVLLGFPILGYFIFAWIATHLGVGAKCCDPPPAWGDSGGEFLRVLFLGLFFAAATVSLTGTYLFCATLSYAYVSSKPKDREKFLNDIIEEESWLRRLIHLCSR